jgi:hypothetical protein
VTGFEHIPIERSIDARLREPVDHRELMPPFAFVGGPVPARGSEQCIAGMLRGIDHS